MASSSLIPLTLSLLSFLPIFSFAALHHRHKQSRPPVALWSVGPEELCPASGGPGQHCNSHNAHFHCDCTSAAKAAVKMEKQSEYGHNRRQKCQSVLPPVTIPGEQLLSIGIAFPIVEQFQDDPEGVFLEDLEIFTFIPRGTVLIYGRGCNPERSAYEFQIGVLETGCGSSRDWLRTLSPQMFLGNPIFMGRNALKVAYVRRVSLAQEEKREEGQTTGHGQPVQGEEAKQWTGKGTATDQQKKGKQ